MPSANRCPECRETIHPYAATCSCGADLDAFRQRRAAGSGRRAQLSLPGLSKDVTDLLVVGLIMLLLALFAPLYGAVLALIVFLQAQHNGVTARRNVAAVCAGLAIFNLVFPSVLLPHLL
jgi:uncharacterized iron-regulated membrane protein